MNHKSSNTNSISSNSLDTNSSSSLVGRKMSNRPITNKITAEQRMHRDMRNNPNLKHFNQSNEFSENHENNQTSLLRSNYPSKRHEITKSNDTVQSNGNSTTNQTSSLEEDNDYYSSSDDETPTDEHDKQLLEEKLKYKVSYDNHHFLKI